MRLIYVFSANGKKAANGGIRVKGGTKEGVLVGFRGRFWKRLYVYLSG